jgi:aminopeptidase N
MSQLLRRFVPASVRLPRGPLPAAVTVRAAFTVLAAFALVSLGACGGTTAPAPQDAAAAVDDPHSYAEPWRTAVSHLSLDLTVDFDAHRLEGLASLTLERRDPDAGSLVLDVRDLDVRAVELENADGERAGAAWELGDADPILGQPLTVELADDTTVVLVDYASSPDAGALLWLDGEGGDAHPFLFTQSQSILARTWVPCQDTPGVRMTYDATVRVPPELLAVMSAENPVELSADGVYRFSMPQPIPSYLLALAVGDLEFRSMGERTGVYAEPPVVDEAAWEFAETEDMMEAAERLYGPYRWGRYDILVLPASFPFGGMENPRLTFATPTVLAGDRSLVSLIAHELGHSWSGNLVTNATWDDFWLNEGFTTYVERRLMEELRGPDYAAMLWALGRRDLDAAIERAGADDPHTALRVDLAGEDPDAGISDVAYEKGSLFLRMLEEAAGRERWDPFLRSWFDDHAFQSVTTEEFLAFLDEHLLAPTGLSADDLQIQAWVYGPGLPSNAPSVESAAFAAVAAQRDRFLAGTPAADLAVDGWSSHEWLELIRGLPADTTPEQMAALDAAFHLTDSGNSEIRFAWYMLGLRVGYQPVYPAVEDFLTAMGRTKFVAPLFATLARSDDGRAFADEIYRRARPTYHPLTRGAVDRILDWKQDDPQDGSK